MAIEEVKNIFDCQSGNTGLTEQFIYNNSLVQGEAYQVLSSATMDSTSMGTLYIDSNDVSFTTFSGKIGILIARNGKAGQMKFLPRGRYVTNDHAYILSVKRGFKEKYNINCKEEEYFLKYFIFKYQHDMYQFASKNDNATWNKTAFFKYFKIEIPSKSVMERVAKQYNDIIDYRKLLQNKINELDALLNKTVIVEES